MSTAIFKTIRDESDIADLIREFVDAEKESLASELSGLESDVEDLQSQVEDLTEQCDELRADNAALDDRCEAYEATINELRIALEELENVQTNAT